VPFPSRAAAGAIGVRPGARLAVAVLRHRSRRAGARRCAEELGPGGRPRDLRGRSDHHRGPEGRMAVKVLIPTPLRPYVDGRDTLELEGASVGELLQRLAGEYAALKQQLIAPDRRLRSFVTVYENDRNIRRLPQQEARIGPGTTLSIITR